MVCDEAHRMAASFFGAEVRYTKRYRLGRLLGARCRHFLLMTATPHNGKEEDFRLFMALLDPNRFEGRFRGGASRDRGASRGGGTHQEDSAFRGDGASLGRCGRPAAAAHQGGAASLRRPPAVPGATRPYRALRAERRRSRPLCRGHRLRARGDGPGGTLGGARREAAAERRLRPADPPAPARLLARRDPREPAPPPRAAGGPARPPPRGRRAGHGPHRAWSSPHGAGRHPRRAGCGTHRRERAPRRQGSPRPPASCGCRFDGVRRLHPRRRLRPRRSRRGGAGRRRCDRGPRARPRHDGGDRRRIRDRDRRAEAPRRPRAGATARRHGYEMARAREPPRSSAHDRRRRAAAKAHRLHRAARHPRIPRGQDPDPPRPGRGGDRDPRRGRARGSAQGRRGVHARPGGRGDGRERCGRRGRQPPARPPDGQLRSALEPEPPGAALRADPPHRPERGLPSVEPRREGHARGGGLRPAARKAGDRPLRPGRTGLRRARTPLRGRRDARPADGRRPLR